MTIVNPLVSANLVVQSTVSSNRPEERQLDLRLEQIVRATVVEGGLDKAMLELNHQRFRINSEQELRTGQQLELQVLTTQPKLTFKVLSLPFETRLAALLPLLNKPYDWHGLLEKLGTADLPREAGLRQTLAQLGNMLRPTAEMPAEKLTDLAVALGQLRRSEPLFRVNNGPQLASAFDRVLQTLSQRVDGFDLPQQLKVMALQVRQQPELLQSFLGNERGKLELLLQKIDQPQEQLNPPQARQLAAELRRVLVDRPEVLPRNLTLLSQELGQLLSNAPARDFELTPLLHGQLKTLAGQLQLASKQSAVWSGELQQVVGQVLGVLQPLLTEPAILARGEQLGLLGQLFGLNLEAELLRGRTREALNGLKLVLLGEQQRLGSEGEEALHRLELFQVCRVKLAEQNQLFFPLPLPFLEEGFLLVDDEGHEEETEAETKVRRMSLHLRLSALGSLRVDMLNEPSGMLLRIACEDQERASFLQSLGTQLQERLQSVKIRGVSFTVGVETPARELIERLVPRSKSMFDARV